MGRGGDGVVEAEEGGSLFFVPGAFPGERVRFAPASQKRRGAGRGQLLEVVEAREDRREPPCPIASECGGCPWMAIEPSGQRALKADWGRRLAERVGFAGEVPLVADAALAYRRRARLAWAPGAMGYRSAGSHRIVDAAACLVLQPELATAWAELRSLGPALSESGEIRMYRIGNGVAALLETEAPQTPALYAACEALVREGKLLGIGLRVGEGEPAAFGSLEERYLGPDGEPLEGAPGGFSQAHDPLSSRLAEDVAARVGGGRTDGPKVLELYAGHGSFTVLLAASAGALTAVEVSRAACEALQRNLAIRSLEAKVVVADAGAHPKAFDTDLDVLVLDPPRAGAKEPLERLLAGRSRPRIVYVSCDLATLERDLRLLREADYEVEELRLYDLFPQTARVEALACLAPPRSSDGAGGGSPSAP